MSTEQSAGELAAELRETRRRLQATELTLARESARADRLERDLAAATDRANRLATDRDEHAARARDVSLGYARLQEAMAQDTLDWGRAGQLARFVARMLAESFELFLPDAERHLLHDVKPGRIPVLLIEIGGDLLAPKDLPERPGAPGFARKDLLTYVEAHLRQGYQPVLIHLRERKWRPGMAETHQVVSIRPDGLDPYVPPSASAQPVDTAALRRALEEGLRLAEEIERHTAASRGPGGEGSAPAGTPAAAEGPGGALAGQGPEAPCR